MLGVITPVEDFSAHYCCMTWMGLWNELFRYIWKCLAVSHRYLCLILGPGGILIWGHTTKIISQEASHQCVFALWAKWKAVSNGLCSVCIAFNVHRWFYLALGGVTRDNEKKKSIKVFLKKKKKNVKIHCPCNWGERGTLNWQYETFICFCRLREHFCSGPSIDSQLERWATSRQH